MQLTTELLWYFIDVGVVFLTTLGRSWLASMILWKPSSSLGVLDRRLWLCLELYYSMRWQLAWLYKNSPTLAASSTRTWVNQLFLLFSGWDVCRKINSYNGLRGLLITYYLRESLCRREEVLSAARIPLFWEHSFVSLRFLDVFSGGGWLCLCFLGLVWFAIEDIWLFAFHLFSYKLRIVDRLQNVDDRQSLERARHGLKKKKEVCLL